MKRKDLVWAIYDNIINSSNKYEEIIFEEYESNNMFWSFYDRNITINRKVKFWDIIQYFENKWYDLLWTEMFEFIFNNYEDKWEPIESQKIELLEYIYNLIKEE